MIIKIKLFPLRAREGSGARDALCSVGDPSTASVCEERDAAGFFDASGNAAPHLPLSSDPRHGVGNEVDGMFQEGERSTCLAVASFLRP
ncbi:unnamed protein product [Ixodes persulcatus]